MNKQEYISLLDRIYPDFFERDIVRGLPDDLFFDEMILPLSEFDIHKYDKKLDDNITFGFYEGDLDELKKDVERVVEYWAQSFGGMHRIYCGFIDGKVASFCLVENKGTHITSAGASLK